MDNSPKFQLAQDRLGADLNVWINRCRDEGLSWRQISLRLRDKTKVDVTDVTLRAWATEQETAS